MPLQTNKYKLYLYLFFFIFLTSIFNFKILDNYQEKFSLKKIYIYGIAITSAEKDDVIYEAKQILDVEDVIASILGKLALTNKILWSVHHDFIASDNSVLRNIQVKFLSIISNFLTDKIIFCSKESLNNHVQLGYSKRKSVIINNGICTKKFYPRK